MAQLEIEWTNLKRVLLEYAEFFIEQARDTLIANDSWASGKLANTMEPIIEVTDNHYSVKIRLEDYWKYVESGRPPGKGVPVQKLIEWIRIKPVVPKVMTLTRKWYVNDRKKGEPKTIERSREYQHLPSVEELAFLINRSIKENGIKPRKFFKNNVSKANNYYKNLIVAAIREDINAFMEKCMNERIYKQIMSCL